MNDDHVDDRKLRELARHLGAAPAERLDVEQVAAAVVRRLREQPHREPSPWWVQPAWLRAAAVLVLMLGVGLVAREWLAPPHPSHYVAEELDDLSTDQLREVLGTLDQTLDDDESSESLEDLNDFTTEQLQTLLRTLEGES